MTSSPSLTPTARRARGSPAVPLGPVPQLRRADALREAPLELGKQRSEREPPGAQYLEHPLLLALTEQRTRERNLSVAHARCLASMPRSSDSTSASHDAATTFSERSEEHTSELQS